MDLRTALRFALDGNALLILGAGFSVESTNVRGECIPTVSKLVDKIYSEIYNEFDVSDDEKEPLEELSERCIEEGHSEELCRLLKELFTQQACSTADNNANAAIILNLPWRRIYTTNYDNVAENYSSNCGIVRTPVTLCDDIKEHNGDNVIIHINGYIADLTPSRLGNDFKLTTSSYLIASYQKNEWIMQLKSDIDAASAVVLVGVSGNSDLDLKRLIFNEGQYREKLIFVDIKEKRFDIRRKFGSISTVGLAGMATEVQKVKETHHPVEQSIAYSCFKRLSLNRDVKGVLIDSTVRRNMLEKGIFDEDILAHHIRDNEYLFWRKEVTSIETCFSLNKARCVCVTSRLANGKTCLTYLLSAELLSKSWDVFLFEHDNVHLQIELDSFRTTRKKTLIIVESYHLYFTLLDKLRRALDNQNVYLLLSSRTGIHVSVCQRLPFTLGISDEQIQEVNLDVLDSEDIDSFIKLLEKDDYLLPERQKSINEKRKLLTNKCHSCISEALLELVHSQEVRTRIDNSCQTLSENPIAKTVAYSSLILLLLNVDLTTNELFTVLNIQGLPQSAINNPGFKDLIDFQGGRIHVHSTIFAKYVISKLPISEILEYMTIINENADSLFSENKVNAIRSSFVTYSNINLLVPIRMRSYQMNQQILEYYYNLSQRNYYDDNPFFWLQYAIVSMDVSDYKRAEELIDKAYSCASAKRNFDTFQIDTQYGRLVLEKICGSQATSIKPFEDFTAADNAFKSALRSPRGNVRQVIKQVIKAYPIFYTKYASMLSPMEKNHILRSTTDFIEAANNNNKAAMKRKRISEIISDEDLQKLISLRMSILSPDID